MTTTLVARTRGESLATTDTTNLPLVEGLLTSVVLQTALVD